MSKPKNARYYTASVEIEVDAPASIDGRERLTLTITGMEEAQSPAEAIRQVAAKVPEAVESRLSAAEARMAA